MVFYLVTQPEPVDIVGGSINKGNPGQPRYKMGTKIKKGLEKIL
jgi:hypothetical protein